MSAIKQALAEASRLYVKEVGKRKAGSYAEYAMGVRESAGHQHWLRNQLLSGKGYADASDPITKPYMDLLFGTPLNGIERAKPARRRQDPIHSQYSANLLTYLDQFPQPETAQVYHNPHPMTLIIRQRHRLFSEHSLDQLDVGLASLASQISRFADGCTMYEENNLRQLRNSIRKQYDDPKQAEADAMTQLIRLEPRFFRKVADSDGTSDTRESPEQFVRYLKANRQIYHQLDYKPLPDTLPYNLSFSRWHMIDVQHFNFDIAGLITVLGDPEWYPEFAVCGVRVSTTHNDTAKFFAEELTSVPDSASSYERLLSQVSPRSPVGQAMKMFGAMSLTEVSMGPQCVYLTFPPGIRVSLKEEREKSVHNFALL
ncbi:hypothetical protein DIURU_001178 [Diutina rugosa]|uniref:Uncharacterized protein n=1 Tax=Diutina rugosa TaxID=5481 RepID=A0A642UX87_DIURU|nr:uncharacterized protein DIURU_001178 [Diutina rugosa]KAA8906236.1 hypothetical protein DIURU_001178 [Diutina rugosa]